VAAGQLGLIGGTQPIFFFFPNPLNTSIQLLLEAQQHKKYAQTTPLDDGVSLGVSSLLLFISVSAQMCEKNIRSILKTIFGRSTTIFMIYESFFD
jgi:hypothetical protein